MYKYLAIISIGFVFGYALYWIAFKLISPMLFILVEGLGITVIVVCVSKAFDSRKT